MVYEAEPRVPRPAIGEELLIPAGKFHPTSNVSPTTSRCSAAASTDASPGRDEPAPRRWTPRPYMTVPKAASGLPRPSWPSSQIPRHPCLVALGYESPAAHLLFAIQQSPFRPCRVILAWVRRRVSASVPVLLERCMVIDPRLTLPELVSTIPTASTPSCSPASRCRSRPPPSLSYSTCSSSGRLPSNSPTPLLPASASHRTSSRSPSPSTFTSPAASPTGPSWPQSDGEPRGP